MAYSCQVRIPIACGAGLTVMSQADAALTSAKQGDSGFGMRLNATRKEPANASGSDTG